MPTQIEEIVTKYKTSITEFDLHFYSQSQEDDFRITSWYMHLLTTNDIAKIAAPRLKNLSSFLDFVRGTLFVYHLDRNNQINFAFWAEGTDDILPSPAYLGLWVSDSFKRTKRNFFITHLLYTISLEVFHDLLGTTWQQDLLAEHAKLGYTVVGMLPNLYRKEMTYIVHLNQEKFEASRFHALKQRRAK